MTDQTPAQARYAAVSALYASAAPLDEIGRTATALGFDMIDYRDPARPEIEFGPAYPRNIAPAGSFGTPYPDTLNSRIIGERLDGLTARRAREIETGDGPGVVVGDWVRFADGTMRRVAEIFAAWDDKNDAPAVGMWRIQTSAGGSFHLGGRGLAAIATGEPIKTAHVSMSGSLYGPVNSDTLSPEIDPETGTQRTEPAPFWIFHHDTAGAQMGLHFRAPAPVWACTEEATR